MSATTALDLHSLAVLINYERTSGPFRDPHSRLKEIASPEGRFASILSDNYWPGLAVSHPKYGFFLLVDDATHTSEDDDGDLPSNFLWSQADSSLSRLKAHELETIFYQVRGHDACYHTIGIFQHLADMYPPNQPLRIRLHNGTDFTTSTSHRDRSILEYKLYHPKQTTLSITGTLPANTSGRVAIHTTARYTGLKTEMKHAVWEFFAEDGESVILDIASMQFGAHGRGKTEDFFVLDTIDGWHGFLGKIVGGCEHFRSSDRINPSPDPTTEEWIQKVAARVKERWDARQTEHWCALCGKPGFKKRCGRCSEAHSKAAWKKRHKKWCGSVEESTES
ncbi:hypothetical protein H0H81_009846 [Sphagnurus paluster]|uniref:MYND-type domain-containing protein n=1 Tax=Sphagnurus paluster TaxID=117069 RepID=A0A9P7K3X6_9AGAR|nr:hypothetical protein H0H81_009846 [Sphagnurus paluster]